MQIKPAQAGFFHLAEYNLRTQIKCCVLWFKGNPEFYLPAYPKVNLMCAVT